MGILLSILYRRRPTITPNIESGTVSDTLSDTLSDTPSDTPSDTCLSNCIFTPKGIKLALLIGIDYQGDMTSGNDLNGCMNDTMRLKDYLLQCCYFQEQDITVLSSPSETTKNSIQGQLRELVFFSYKYPNTELWFSFSGHGSSAYRDVEQDNPSEVICPSDYNNQGVIYDSWLKNHFINRLHASTKLFILMDCCHSGTNVTLPYQFTNNEERLIRNPNVSLLATVVKLSGCQDQYKKEYQGALTTCFLAKANEYNGTLFSLLYDNVKQELQHKSFQQTPLLTFSQLGL